MYFNKNRKIFLIVTVIFIVFLLSTIMVSAKNYEWKCIIAALGTTSTDSIRVIAKDIEEATNGQLKIDVFLPGEHPYKLGDQLKAVSEGEVQMGCIIGGYVSGIEPRFMAIDLPLLIPAGNFDIYRSLIAKFMDGFYQEIFNEWGVHPVLYSLTPSQNYYLKEGWIENSNSLKGKKIRSWSKEVSDLIVLMGGIPVTLAYEEVPSALQTGLLDGTTTNFVSAYNSNLFEQCKNINMLQASFSEEIFVVNNKAWSELPDDLKELVQGIFDSEQETFEWSVYNPLAMAFEQACAKYSNITIRPLPKDFRNELVEGAYEAIWKPWVDRTGEKGLEAFKIVVNELEDMGYKIPLK